MRISPQKENFVLSLEVEDKITNLFQHMRRKEGDHFGNARTANNLFEHMKNRLAERFMQVYTFTGSEVFDEIHFQNFVVADVEDFMNDFKMCEDNTGLELTGISSKTKFPDLISVEPLRLDSH